MISEIHERAFADGRAGRPVSSEHADYAPAYRAGRMLAGAEARDFILFAMEGSQCQRCETVFVGEVGACGCDLPGEQALVRGAHVVYGPADGGGNFMSAGELAVLFATGLRLLTVDGTDVSCQIQPPQ